MLVSSFFVAAMPPLKKIDKDVVVARTDDAPSKAVTEKAKGGFKDVKARCGTGGLQTTHQLACLETEVRRTLQWCGGQYLL